MSIEVRNVKPEDNSSNISVNRNIEFDLVATTDSDTIDISSLRIRITTTSVIDGTESTLTYNALDTDVISLGGDYYSFGNFYHITVNPDRPFDHGMTVNLSVRVDDTDGNPMDEFTACYTTIYNDLISDFRYAFLDHAQNIPVYNEVLLKNSTTSPTIFDAAFNNWNKKPTPRIEVNEVLTTTGFTINYDEGTIIFDSALEYNDWVRATYRFSFFSDEQIESYFRQATAIWNMNPPYGGVSNIYVADFTLRSVLMIGAATFAFRDLLMSLAFQEKRIIFDNTSWNESWKSIHSLFKDLAESYKNDWEKLLEAKKFRLPRISSIVVPEYTLPGGRSRFFRYIYKGS